MCRSSAQDVVRKKGWVFTSEAPAREPRRRSSSLIRSLRMSDLQRLQLSAGNLQSERGGLLGDRRCPGTFWEWYVVAKNVGKSRIAVLAFEWGCTVEHLVDQDTKRPPIDGAGVTAALDDLGRDVLLSTYERVRPEIRYTRLCVNCWQITRRCTISTNDHGRPTAWLGLLRQVKV